MRWPGCCPLPGATTATAVTAFCPPPRNAEELADLDALGAEFGPTPLVVSSLATAEDTSALIDIVAKFCVSREISTRNTKPPSWT